MLIKGESQLFQENNPFPTWARFVLRLSLIGGLALANNACSRPDAFCEVGGLKSVSANNLGEYFQSLPEASVPPCSTTVQSSITNQRRQGKSTFLLPEELKVVRY